MKTTEQMKAILATLSLALSLVVAQNSPLRAWDGNCGADSANFMNGEETFLALNLTGSFGSAEDANGVVHYNLNPCQFASKAAADALTAHYSQYGAVEMLEGSAEMWNQYNMPGR